MFRRSADGTGCSGFEFGSEFSGESSHATPEYLDLALVSGGTVFHCLLQPSLCLRQIIVQSRTILGALQILLCLV